MIFHRLGWKDFLNTGRKNSEEEEQMNEEREGELSRTRTVQSEREFDR
jgi:hypothetical protein